MSAAARRWGLRLLRYGLCAAAIAWLVAHVPWHDRVRLGGPDGPWVRLIEQDGARFVIEQEGQRRTVTLADIHVARVADRDVPDIELGIPRVLAGIDRRKALWAVLLFLPVVLLQSLRLVLMIGVQGVWLSPWSAIKLTFAGNFFNFALPGTTGGDLIKAYYVAQYTHLKTEVVTTIFLDRAVGLLGLVILAAGAMLAQWDPERFGHLLAALGIVSAALAAGAAVVFSRRLRGALRLPTLAARLPFGAQLLRIGRATVALRHHKALLAASMLLTLALQSLVMISAVFAARALGMAGSPAAIFVYVSVGFLIAAVPIAPPQAIGVMEAAYVSFFTRGDLNTPSQAVALALAVRLIQLVWALPGVLVPLLGAHLPKRSELAQLQRADADSAGDGRQPAASS